MQKLRDAKRVQTITAAGIRKSAAEVIPLRLKHILPIASGKGGVGKTLLSVLASIILSEFGETALVDLDPLPDADILLIPGNRNGQSSTHPTLSDHLLRGIPIEQVMIPGPKDKLHIVKGGIHTESQSFFKDVYASIEKIPADFVVVDLGAGCAHAEFTSRFASFLMVCEPTHGSIRDAEVYIRNVIVNRYEQAIGQTLEPTLKEWILRHGFTHPDLDLSLRRGLGRVGLSQPQPVLFNNVGPGDKEFIDYQVNNWRSWFNPINCGSVPTSQFLRSLSRSHRDGQVLKFCPSECREPLQVVLHVLFKSNVFLSDRNTWQSVAQKVLGWLGV
jgi:MinD-like ATPase involved in chromosome partitioning or flagellar assembly